MVLHTLNAPPNSAAFQDCLAAIAPGDALLLLGDGVYCALGATPACDAILRCGAQLYALDKDARAAGIIATPDTVTITDMTGFVALTARYPRQLAWY